MSRTRGAAPILPITVVIAGFTALSATSAAPIAHADTIDNIIGTVVKDRAKTHCPPLHYDLILEAAARQETLQKTATVTADVDVFDNPNGDGQALPNFLKKGTKVAVKSLARQTHSAHSPTALLRGANS